MELLIIHLMVKIMIFNYFLVVFDNLTNGATYLANTLNKIAIDSVKRNN